jgi:hypothetical protein
VTCRPRLGSNELIDADWMAPTGGVTSQQADMCRRLLNPLTKQVSMVVLVTFDSLSDSPNHFDGQAI